MASRDGHHARPGAPALMRSIPADASGGVGWHRAADMRARPGAPALMPSLPARRLGRGSCGANASAFASPRSRRAHATRSSRNRAWPPAPAHVRTCGLIGMAYQCGRGALRAPAARTRGWMGMPKPLEYDTLASVRRSFPHIELTSLAKSEFNVRISVRFSKKRYFRKNHSSLTCGFVS